MTSCSVVILNWNGEKHLAEFLPSVIKNRPEWVDVIVADNGSTDNSLPLCRDIFPSVKIIELDKNYGFAEGYNRALEKIDTEYFVLLNSDVEVMSGWIEPLIEFMDEHKEYGVVSPKILSYTNREYFEYAGACGGFIDKFGYPFCRGRILSTVEKDTKQYDNQIEVFWASGAAFMVRSEVYRKVGGFDSDFFAHMEEIDFCWRAQLLGYKIGVVPQSIVYHLGGGTLPVSSPMKTFLNYRNNLAMLYKNLPNKKVYTTLFCRMTLDGASSLVYLLTGRIELFKAVFRAHIEFYKWLKSLRKKRATIQSTAINESTQIYNGSILLGYLLGQRRFSSYDLKLNKK